MNVVCLFVFRAEASVPRLAELNPYVTVKASTETLTEDSQLDFLCNFQVSALWVLNWMPPMN